MSQVKKELMHTFYIDYESEQDACRYKGQFTIKKLSVRDLGLLSVRKNQMNGGMYYDPSLPGQGLDAATDEFNHMFAHLEFSIKSAPEWWDLDQITDVDLVGKVFKEVVEFEQSFLSRRSDYRGRSKARSKKAVQEPNSDRVPADLVEEEVQAALEP